jgi:putative cardiolipin synthase
MHRDMRGETRWLDRMTAPPTLLAREPGTGAWQRGSARVISWLPIESQL